LVDALAVLLTRIHLAGFYWGDCSLNNALFRRDAGALRAYVVDTETGELHDQLSDGQRLTDLNMGVDNIAGGLLDLQAGGFLEAEADPIAVALEIERRYGELWEEVTRVDEFGANELWRVQARVRRLNELGFDANELQVTATSGGRMQVRPTAIEEGHHRRRLARLVGIAAHENQARRLLEDIETFRNWLSSTAGSEVPEAIAAYHWLTERWEPVIAPVSGSTEIEPAQFFHEVLDHCWFMSERAGTDVGLEAAAADYLARS
jgi:hypothetical protein